MKERQGEGKGHKKGGKLTPMISLVAHQQKQHQQKQRIQVRVSLLGEKRKRKRKHLTVKFFRSTLESASIEETNENGVANGRHRSINLAHDIFRKNAVRVVKRRGNNVVLAG